MPVFSSQYRQQGVSGDDLDTVVEANIEDLLGDVSELNVAGSTDLVDAVNDMNDFPSLVLLFENNLI